MSASIVETLQGLSLSDSKITELTKKTQVVQNIERILESSPDFTKMHYTLACTAPKNTDIEKICGLIDSGAIKHESMLRGVMKYYEAPAKEDVAAFIKRNDCTREEIAGAIDAQLPASKGAVLRELKKAMPYADSKVVVELVNEKCTDAAAPAPATAAAPEADDRYKWFEEGEIAQIPKPCENHQADDRILAEHLARTGGIVVTRFPPEPNGQLHIGHAKAINISFLYAEKFGGRTYLRFDDTNPKNEKEEHYKAIIEDVRWLGYEPYMITASSDHTERMHEMAVRLIRKGKAYVCHCSLDDIRKRRQQFQAERDAGHFDPTLLSPYRNRAVDENLEMFDKMQRGEFADGEAVLRFRMDLESKNQHMLDLVGARCIDMVHPGKEKNYRVYPTYEFALCVCDSLEDVTHSFCSREFMTRQESYHWLLKNLDMYEPIQWEFSRLNLSNTVLSKRKMNALVNSQGMEWDDPRFYTIAGMRRRGFPAAAINKFVRNVGITYSETVVDVKILESYVRAELNQTAQRVFCVRSPLKVTVNGLSKRQVDIANVGKKATAEPYAVTVNKVVYIDSSDFSEDASGDFHRLTPSQPVGLLGIGAVKFVERSGDGIVCELCDEKPLKFIHWVPALTHKVTLRLYKPLFKSFNPDAVGFMEDVDLDSLEVVDAYCDPRIAGAKPLDHFQFVRTGFFCCDKTSTESNTVLNLTIPLKNLH
ncbi:glutaminyl-tRNA synthetase [Pancytospora philotis]|nr:glutaminyl-tRNA synthetase [Pancytospora philotis]